MLAQQRPGLRSSILNLLQFTTNQGCKWEQSTNGRRGPIPEKRWSASSIGGMILGVCGFQFFGWAALIPMALGTVFFLAALKANRTLQSSGSTVGGFGDPEAIATGFTGSASIVAGHLGWALVGFLLILGRGTALPGPYLTEATVYAFLFLLFCWKPKNRWSITLLALLQIMELVVAAAQFDRYLNGMTSLASVRHDQAVKAVLVHSIIRVSSLVMLARMYWLLHGRNSQALATAQHTTPTVEELLSKLDELHRNGHITEIELELRRKQILAEV